MTRRLCFAPTCWPRPIAYCPSQCNSPAGAAVLLPSCSIQNHPGARFTEYGHGHGHGLPNLPHPWKLQPTLTRHHPHHLLTRFLITLLRTHWAADPLCHHSSAIHRGVLSEDLDLVCATVLLTLDIITRRSRLNIIPLALVSEDILFRNLHLFITLLRARRWLSLASPAANLARAIASDDSMHDIMHWWFNTFHHIANQDHNPHQTKGFEFAPL